MLDLIIKNGQCYIDGELKDVDVSIKDGKIQQIGQISEKAKNTIDAKGLTVLPGCIDTQTHFREPGSTDTEDLHIQEVELQLLGESQQYLKCPILIHQHQLKKNFKKN